MTQMIRFFAGCHSNSDWFNRSSILPDSHPFRAQGVPTLPGFGWLSIPATWGLPPLERVALPVRSPTGGYAGTPSKDVKSDVSEERVFWLIM